MVLPVVVVPFKTFGHEIALSKPRLSQTPRGRCVSQPSLKFMQRVGLKDWKSGPFGSEKTTTCLGQFHEYLAMRLQLLSLGC